MNVPENNQSQNQEEDEEMARILQSMEEEFQWIPASQVREAGDRDIPECLQDLFSKQIATYKMSRQSIDAYLDFHPEPRGGFLRAPKLQSSIELPEVDRKQDECVADIQRAFLLSLRPLLSAVEKISESSDKATATAAIRDIRGAVRLLLHATESLNTHRRFTVVRKMGWNCPYEQLWDNVNPEPKYLFSEELKKTLEDKVKTSKNVHSPSQSTSRGGGRFQGRGGHRNNYNRGGRNHNKGYNQQQQLSSQQFSNSQSNHQYGNQQQSFNHPQGQPRQPYPGTHQ